MSIVLRLIKNLLHIWMQEKSANIYSTDIYKLKCYTLYCKRFTYHKFYHSTHVENHCSEIGWICFLWSVLLNTALATRCCQRETFQNLSYIYLIPFMKKKMKPNYYSAILTSHFSWKHKWATFFESIILFLTLFTTVRAATLKTKGLS